MFPSQPALWKKTRRTAEMALPPECLSLALSRRSLTTCTLGRQRPLATAALKSREATTTITSWTPSGRVTHRWEEYGMSAFPRTVCHRLFLQTGHLPLPPGMEAQSIGGASCLIKDEPDFIETTCKWIGCDRGDLITQDALVKVSNFRRPLFLTLFLLRSICCTYNYTLRRIKLSWNDDIQNLKKVHEKCFSAKVALELLKSWGHFILPTIASPPITALAAYKI